MTPATASRGGSDCNGSAAACASLPQDACGSLRVYGSSSAATLSYPRAIARSGAAAVIRPSPATGAIASSTSAISSSLAPAASARRAPHSRHPGRPDRGERCYPEQCRGLGVQHRGRGQIEPESGLPFDQPFIDHRQPVQVRLESPCLVHHLYRHCVLCRMGRRRAPLDPASEGFTSAAGDERPAVILPAGQVHGPG